MYLYCNLWHGMLSNIAHNSPHYEIWWLVANRIQSDMKLKRDKASTKKEKEN